MTRKPHQAKRSPGPPSYSEFLRHADRIRERALKVLQQDGHHANIVICFTRDGSEEVVGIGSLPAEMTMGEALRAICRARRVHSFVAVHEAWMTRGPAASLVVPPSKHPEREQVLCVSAIHPQTKRMWVYPFASEGGRVVLGKMLSSEAEGVTLGGGIPEALGGQEGG